LVDHAEERTLSEPINEPTFSIADDVRIWTNATNSFISIKAVSDYDDPVELCGAEAIELAARLGHTPDHGKGQSSAFQRCRVVNERGKEYFKIHEQVYLWIEQETSVHLRAGSKTGDAIELTESQTTDLAEILETLGCQVEGPETGNIVP
jgi:hypothetical protein